MFLSWWRSLVQLANPKNENSKVLKRRRVPRKFRSAMRVEQLEDRLVPTAGTAKVFLNVGTVATPSNTITAARGTIVPVFIDFNSITAGSSGGLGAGTFYVLYDPTVLSISETFASVNAPTPSVGADIKLGSLISTPSLNYSVVPASGFAAGVVAIGLNHSGTTFLSGSPTGHLIELDFHVVSSAPSIGFTTLLDFQTTYSDANNSLHGSNIHDKGAQLYGLTPSPGQYAKLTSQSALTQSGALIPNSSTNHFTPNDADATDAAIQIIQSGTVHTPTAVADTYSMAPNTPSFYTTMAVAGVTNPGSTASNNEGPLNGVLANDTNAAPMYSVLTGSGVTNTVLPPSFDTINGLTESGMVVTVSTSHADNFMPGQAIIISGVGTSGYNSPTVGGVTIPFEIATVDPVNQLFTYVNSVSNGIPVMGLGPDAGGAGAFASTPAATTIYSANTPNGTVSLNSADGTFAYTPSPGYTGTDTFTYQSVDAASNTASANTTVTIYVGGVLNMPQVGLGSATAAIGDTVVVPVNILNPNVVNSGGLGNVTIAINYDPTVFDGVTNVPIVSEGDVNSFAGWGAFTSNTNTAGQIIITSSDTGGPPPIFSTTGGALAFITFTVIGFPSNANGPGGTGTTVINLASAVPQTSQLDVIATGTPVSLPMAFAPLDNTDFNGAPGVDDGLVILPAGVVPAGTTTTVSATLGGSSFTTVQYGTQVTLTASVSKTGGGAPTGGTVDFKDGSTDLTPGGITGTVSGGFEIFTYITTQTQLQVLQAGGGPHNSVTAAFTGSDGNSTGTVNPGFAVTPAPLTITATTNAKTYDSTTTAGAAPTVSGLFGSDRVTNLAEVYSNANTGSSKTLSVSAFLVQDGSSTGSLDYTVTTVPNTTGVITKANLTITASTNTKTYDATTAATTAPTVSGLIGGDTVSGFTSVYANANVGNSKTISVTAYTVNDGNSGNNYAVTTVANTTGSITKAPLTITAVTNTKPSDGNTSAAAVPTVSGLKGSDTVTGLVEVYSDSNVGSSKTLSVSAYTVNDGNTGGNYAVTLVPNATGAIVQTSGFTTVTAVQTSSASVVYGTSVTFTITVTNTQTSAPPTGAVDVHDNSTDLGPATFQGSSGTSSIWTLVTAPTQLQVLNPAVHTITAFYSDASSTFQGSSGTVAQTVTPAPLTITATTNTKTYDSTTSAAATPTVTGLLGSDTVTNAVEVYVNSSVGTGKTLSVFSFTPNYGPLDYTVTTVANTTGAITKANLTITATTNAKTYDSTTTAGAAPTVSGLVGGDTVTGLSEGYATASVGTSKTLNVNAGYTVNDGNGGGNYAVTTVANTTGSISKANLTITATTNAKTYDSTTTAGATPTVSGLIGGDTVTGGKEVYSNANVGVSKTLSVSAYTVNDGNGGGNYAVTTVANTTGSITKAPLTVTAVTNTKPSDGNTSAAAIPTVSGLIGGDTATGLVEVYSDSNVGSNKTLSVSSYTVNDGNSGGNYAVTLVPDATGAIVQSTGFTTATVVQTSSASVVYGTSVTFTITVTDTQGSAPPTGAVDVHDNAADLGPATFQGSNNNVSTWTLVTAPTKLQVLIPAAHTITAFYSDASSTFQGSSGTVAQTVTPAPLTITATTNAKTYDSTTTAGAAPTVSGLQGSDTVTGLAEAYANANVGSSKTLSVTAYTVNDGSSLDYNVTTVANTTGVITKANLTITATTNAKTYDSTTTAGATPTVSGLIGGDTVTGGKEVYSNANVGVSKTLSVSAYTVNDGNGGGNYAVTTVANSTGSITKASLTITATTNAKTYDSTTTAGAAPTVSGLVGGDTVTGLSEAYATASVGTGKTLNVNSGYTVNDGNGGGNYTVTTVANTTGSITKASLTITATTNAKTYDSTTTAGATPTVSGLVGGDTVSGLSEAYATASVGTGKTLNVNGGYTVNDGNGGGNYAVTTVANTTGSITKANLTITATTNAKTYDSTTTAGATPTVSGLIGGDTVTGGKEVYSNANVGVSKTLSVSAYTVNDGNGGGNYSVTTVTNTSGVITKANLVITATTNAKTYDSTTTAGAAPTVSGLVGGDTVTGLNEAYATASVGTGKTLNVNGGYSVNDGNGGGNYAVTTVANTTGSITKASLTITATTNVKTYDKTTTAGATPTVSGLIGGDTVVGLAEVYANVNVGTGKTLSVSTYTVNDGNGGGNYTVTTVANTMGVITKANLTITASTNTKTYDSTTTAGATPTVSGLISGDTVSGLSEAYASANAGTSKTLNVNGGYTVNDGNGGGNYAVTTVANTTGVITKAALTITATTNTKPSDGNTSAAAIPTVSGLIGGDTATGLVEVYSDPSVGTGKTLSVSSYTVNDGNSGGNYAVTLVPNTTGVILQTSGFTTATVVQTSSASVVYGTSVTFTITVTDTQGSTSPAPTGAVDVHDNANDLGLATFQGSSANVSTWKLITAPTQLQVLNPAAHTITAFFSDSSSTFAGSSGTLANGQTVTPAPLTITATANTKVYDSTTTAGATPTVSGLLGSDSASGLQEAYADANAGTGKTLNVTGYTVNAGSPLDYNVTTVSSAAGVITKASITLTAVTNTKPFDGTTTAAGIPTVSGPIGNDTVSGQTEAYTDSSPGTGKTLTVNPGYTVNDGNGGNNYTVTTVANNTGVINNPNSSITLSPQSESSTVIEPPQGQSFIYNLIITVNQPLDYTVSYKTVNGAGPSGAVAGTDFKGVSNAVVHINNDSSHGSAAKSTAIIPITILGDAPELPGGNAIESFSVNLVWSINNGSGNAVINPSETAISVVNIQQVFAPTITLPSTQANASAAGNPYVILTSNYTPADINPAFKPDDYAQAGGNIYLNYNTKLSGSTSTFSTANVTIPYNSFDVPLAFAGSQYTSNFTIPNFKIPTNPAAGTLTMTLAAVSSNAAIGSPSSGTVGYPQLAAGQPTGAPGGVVLTSASQVSSIVSTAETNWEAVGANPASFKNVQVQIANIGQGVLADTAGSVITISPNAAGFGWYVNTGGSDFQPVAKSADETAKAGTAAVGHMDLLTVVEHELGHVLGLPDVSAGSAPDSLMTQTLSAGMRRMPAAGSLVIGIVPPSSLASQNSSVLQMWPGPTLVPVTTPVAGGSAATAQPQPNSLSALNQFFAVAGPPAPPEASTVALDQVFAVLGQTKGKK